MKIQQNAPEIMQALIADIINPNSSTQNPTSVYSVEDVHQTALAFYLSYLFLSLPSSRNSCSFYLPNSVKRVRLKDGEWPKATLSVLQMSASLSQGLPTFLPLHNTSSSLGFFHGNNYCYKVQHLFLGALPNPMEELVEISTPLYIGTSTFSFYTISTGLWVLLKKIQRKGVDSIRGLMHNLLITYRLI